jgi:hypothetical protein
VRLGQKPVATCQELSSYLRPHKSQAYLIMKFSLRSLLYGVLCAGIFSACTAKVEVTEEGVYGDGIKNSQVSDYQTVMTALSSKDTVHTTLKATVSEVCQAKGCWMTVHDKNSSPTEIMVRFKDYGFFVPKDIGGREVIVEGKAFKSVTSVDELRHYAEDAGKSKEEIEAITTPEETFSFEATGVKVLDKM